MCLEGHAPESRGWRTQGQTGGGALMSTVTRAVVAALAAVALVAPAARADDVVNPWTRFWVNPESTTLQAAKQLTGTDRLNALKLAAIPRATWLTNREPGGGGGGGVGV